MSSVTSTERKQYADFWKSANQAIIAGSEIRASSVQGSFFWSKYREFFQSILTIRITVSEGCRQLLPRKALTSASGRYTALWAKPGLSTGTADLTVSQRLIPKLKTKKFQCRQATEEIAYRYHRGPVCWRKALCIADPRLLQRWDSRSWNAWQHEEGTLYRHRKTAAWEVRQTRRNCPSQWSWLPVYKLCLPQGTCYKRAYPEP